MYTHHVCIILDGVRRLSKSKSTCLISYPHTHPHTPTPFAPASSQGLSPSSTIYTHATMTIWFKWHHYIHHAHDPPSPPPPITFFDLIATSEQRDSCTHLPQCIYHTTVYWPIMQELVQLEFTLNFESKDTRNLYRLDLTHFSTNFQNLWWFWKQQFSSREWNPQILCHCLTTFWHSLQHLFNISTCCNYLTPTLTVSH